MNHLTKLSLTSAWLTAVIARPPARMRIAGPRSDTPDFLVSNLADEIHLNRQDKNAHSPRNPLVQNDPSRYAGIQDVTGGKTLTDRQEDEKRIDRPILWRRGQP